MLSNKPGDHEIARDRIASLLTQKNGEYVIRIGEQPPQEHLYGGDLTDDTPGWNGTARSLEDVETLVQEVTKTVEEVGGRALALFDVQKGHPRTSVLLRLPPPNVSLTPEVRCAVVGNVDSGKSTTLGVLTRGEYRLVCDWRIKLKEVKVYSMMAEGRPVSACSVTNMSLRQAGRPA